MQNKNWRFTISGKGDEPTAVETARSTVEQLRKKNHILTDARFELTSPADSSEASSKVDLLIAYGERSVPSSFVDEESSSGRERSSR